MTDRPVVHAARPGPVTEPAPSRQRPRRKVGLFDATMLVMGGIVGAGIFINPYVVARELPRPGWILGAWALGGAIALLGAFVYAELAARMPEAGGQYAYLREAYHPGIAFLYGWVLLLVIQTGGMAAVAVTFAVYFMELTGLQLSAAALAAVALAALAVVNCLGVRAGSTVQSALMVLKIVAILGLVAGGAWFAAGLAPGLAGDGGSAQTAGGVAGIRERARPLRRSASCSPSARRWCRCSSPTAAGRPPTSSPRRCASRAATCRAP